MRMKDQNWIKHDSNEIKKTKYLVQPLLMAVSWIIGVLLLIFYPSFGGGRILCYCFGLWFSSWGFYSLIARESLMPFNSINLYHQYLTGKSAIALGVIELLGGLLFFWLGSTIGNLN